MESRSRDPSAHLLLVQDPLCVSFWVRMSTEVASVPHLGTLRLLLIPRNVTGLVDR